MLDKGDREGEERESTADRQTDCLRQRDLHRETLRARDLRDNDIHMFVCMCLVGKSFVCVQCPMITLEQIAVIQIPAN